MYIFFYYNLTFIFQEQVCGAQDILEEKGVSRLAVTISALIAVSTPNPRSSAV